MVFIASRRGPLSAPVGLARPAAGCWQDAAQAEDRRLKLPQFSLSQAHAPAAALERFAAVPTLDPAAAAEWEAAAALCPLTALHGPGDALQQLRPQPVPLAGPPRSAGVPGFLLPRTRTPLTDAWERRAACTLDAPCLPSAADVDARAQAVGFAEMVRECGMAPETPVLPEPDREKYRFRPQPVLLPEASSRRPFDALALLLQQQAAGPAPAVPQPQLLDQPVLSGPSLAPGASSLREELGQLAAGSFEGQAGEAGFVRLLDLAPPGSTADLSGHPQPLPAVSSRSRPALPSFVLQAFADAAPQAAPTAAADDCLFTLEAPVLPMASMARGSALVAGAPTAAFSHLFRPLELPAPAPLPPACLVPRGCVPASLAALLAADMQLDGCGLVLPPVELPQTEEVAALPLLALIREECGCRPANTAHLALHLDWSLSTKQGAARPPELVAAARSLCQEMLPHRMAPVAAAGQWQHRRRGALVGQLLAPFSPAGQQAAAEPPLPLRMATAQQPAADKTAAPAVAITASGRQHADGASPPAKRAKQGAAGKADGGGGMRFFLQLQGRGAQPAASGCAASSSSSGSGGSELDAALAAPTVTAHAVELPTAHTTLLRLLLEDERRLVRAAPAPGVAPEAARSDFLSVDVLQRVLEAASGQPAQRELLRTYAAMAVVRQAAAALVHHGVRCAHLYLEQGQAELPGLLAAVTAVRELRAAYQQVEQGRLEDSPKQATLQRILRGAAAITQGAKVCVVGQPHSFFTLYQAAVGAGLAVCQLDRDGSLARAAGASREAVAAAVAQACAGPGAACVLVPAELVAAGGVPLGPFQAVVVYASEPATQAALRPHLGVLACPLHWMEVSLPALQQQKSVAGSAPAAAAVPPAAQAEEAVALQPASRPACCADPTHAAAAAGGGCGGVDWPLIISSDPSRPIRRCRPLYDAVLALERRGAALAERPLALVDAVLSPSAALVVCDNSARKLELDAFLEGLAPVLGRLSFAFAQVVLVCEGTPGFQAQVLCGTARLLALGRRCGLRLQVHATTSPTASAGVVGAVAAAWLDRWQVLGPALQYSVAEEAPKEEAFLTRFYSLNPHSAALLLSLGLSVAQLLRLGSVSPPQLPRALALIPPHCLELFLTCAAHGTPLVGEGHPAASVAHPNQNHASAALEAPATASPRAPGPAQLPAQQGFCPSPGQGSCMPGAWEQQGWAATWDAQGPALMPGPPGHAAAHLPPQQQQQQQQRQQPMHGGAAYAQAEAAQWDPRFQSYAAVDEGVYGRGMQLMRARLNGLPESGGAAAAAAAYQHEQRAEAAAWQQQLLMQHQQQAAQHRVLQQQAEAAAFPTLPVSWDEPGPAGGLHPQAWQQPRAHLPSLPPLPGGRVGAGPLCAQQLPLQQAPAGAWEGRLQRPPAGQQRDEFGVSLVASLSDDESDNAGAAAAQQQQLQQWSTQQVYGGGAAVAGRTAAAAAGQQGGLLGQEGAGQMAAYLSSRKRDFTVARLASRPMSGSAPAAGAAPARGAGQLLAPAGLPEFASEDGEPPGAKHPNGHVNLLRQPSPGRGGGGGGGYRRQGGGGQGGRWGGGRRGGGRWGSKQGTKPSRAW